MNDLVPAFGIDGFSERLRWAVGAMPREVALVEAAAIGGLGLAAFLLLILALFRRSAVAAVSFSFVALAALLVALLFGRFDFISSGTQVLIVCLFACSVLLFHTATVRLARENTLIGLVMLLAIFAMLLAVMFLGETVGRIRWGAALVALAGGVILLRPGAGALEPGAAIAFGAAIILAVEIILIKRITRVEPVLRFLFITNIMGVCMASAAAIPVWRPPSLVEWAVMAFVGLSMVTAQILFTTAMKIADASFIAPFFYATLIFAALYDAVWFGVIPGAVSAIGAAMILGGAMVLAWREARAR